MRTAKIAKFHRGFLTKPDLFSPGPASAMGATSLYIAPFAAPLTLLLIGGGARRATFVWVAVGVGGGGEGVEEG